MIDDVEQGKAKIGFSRTVGAIYNTIFNDIILDGIQIEFIIAVTSQVQLNCILKPTEIILRQN